MARILKHIDQIAREKNRDVLFIEFDRKVFPGYKYQEYKKRAELIEWLETNNIPYEECFGYASDTSEESYRGQLYIDVPFDETLAKYNVLNSHLELKDGELRFKGIGLWVLLLGQAQNNAFMDEPDYVSSLYAD